MTTNTEFQVMFTLDVTKDFNNQVKEATAIYERKTGKKPHTLYIREEDYKEELTAYKYTVIVTTKMQPKHFALGDYEKEIYING